MTEEKTRKKVVVEDIIGIIKTDEPTNSVELKKGIYVVPDKMLKISEGLLEDIRHELRSLTGLKAFDEYEGEFHKDENGYTKKTVHTIDLDYTELIEKIDEILNE